MEYKLEGYYATETRWPLGGVISFGLDRKLLAYAGEPDEIFLK